MSTKLIAITKEELARTPLRHYSPATVYRLIRDGYLKAIRIGRRRYLTDELIEESLAQLAELTGDGEAA